MKMYEIWLRVGWSYIPVCLEKFLFISVMLVILLLMFPIPLYYYLFKRGKKRERWLISVCAMT